MVMSIANNVQSLNAQRSFSKAAGQMSESMGKLSSGTRITRAADDVAGLGISEKLRGEVRGLNQAARNGEDAISMIQTAEGALEEVHSMLQRIRELAVQASNDTLDDTDRGFINLEMSELRSQINDVASDTEFNGKKLASGALTSS
jgi:flagellin